MIDDAMRQIEAENPSLKGALPKVFGRESIDRAILTGLIDLFSNLKLDGKVGDGMRWGTLVPCYEPTQSTLAS